MAKQTITRDLLRALTDASNRSPFRDSLTSQEPVIWRGNVARWDVCVANGIENYLLATDDQLVDLTASGFESITVEVKDALDPSASRLMAKTTGSFDNTLTAAGWNAGTAQHATFLFSDSESNIPAGKYFLIVSAITATGPITLGVTPLLVQEDGTPGDTADPAPNPGSAISEAQADLRYLRLDADGDSNKHGMQALTNGAGSQAVLFTTPFAGTPTFVSASLCIPSGGSFFQIAPDLSTLTTTGFTIVLPDGLTVPATGYKAAWQAFYEP